VARAGAGEENGRGVRVTRAYMAGFGTTGCVLACAAALFALAGGVVGFRGWPQVGGQGSPAVTITPGSRAARERRPPDPEPPS